MEAFAVWAASRGTPSGPSGGLRLAGAPIGGSPALVCLVESLCSSRWAEIPVIPASSGFPLRRGSMGGALRGACPAARMGDRRTGGPMGWSAALIGGVSRLRSLESLAVVAPARMLCRRPGGARLTRPCSLRSLTPWGLCLKAPVLSRSRLLLVLRLRTRPAGRMLTPFSLRSRAPFVLPVMTPFMLWSGASSGAALESGVGCRRTGGPVE